jgi:hypothetical protein
MRTASIGGSGFPGRRFDSSKQYDANLEGFLGLYLVVGILIALRGPWYENRTWAHSFRSALSAFDPKRTSLAAAHMSAFGGKADMAYCNAYVCF